MVGCPRETGDRDRWPGIRKRPGQSWADAEGPNPDARGHPEGGSGSGGAAPSRPVRPGRDRDVIETGDSQHKDKGGTQKNFSGSGWTRRVRIGTPGSRVLTRNDRQGDKGDARGDGRFGSPEKVRGTCVARGGEPA